MRWGWIGLVAAGVAVAGMAWVEIKRPSRASAASAQPDVAVLDGVMAAGAHYVVALDRDGRVHGWGDGGSDGDGVSRKLSSSDRPRTVLAGSGYRRVVAGGNSVHVLDVGGGLWRADIVDIWENARTPTPPSAVFPDRKWQRIATSWRTVAGVARDGSLWYWSDDDVAGALERSGGVSMPVQPRALMRGTRFVDVCMRGVHLHAVDDRGGLWRSDALSRHGGDDIPMQGERSELQRIEASAPLTRVVCRENAGQVLAIDASGRLHGYGANTFGELGTGSARTEGVAAAMQATRIEPVSDMRWAALAVGPGFSLGIAADGSLWGWGRNLDHELGIKDESTDAPTLIDDSRRWASVVASYRGGIAMTADGQLLGWGSNGGGVLGDGGIARTQDVPAPVLTDTRFGGRDARL